jgi:hypothetical protein
MNCVELQRSLAEIEDGSSAEQQAHLQSCTACSALVADLKAIAASAAQLRAADDPSPRVWNSLEIALRREGLIHPPRPAPSLLPALGTRWGWGRWLVPAAAALLIAVGIYVRQSSPRQPVATQIAPTSGAPLTIAMDDNDLLQEIADQSPGVQAQYQDNLRRVNEYIHDAQGDVDANPNDAEARRALTEAYQQKAMLFELAVDRSLP